MDGQVWVVLAGEDYQCAHLSMRRAIYKAAEERGGVATVRNLVEGRERIGIAFQFLDIHAKRSESMRRLREATLAD